MLSPGQISSRTTQFASHSSRFFSSRATKERLYWYGTLQTSRDSR
jgi:hypothetical protein